MLQGAVDLPTCRSCPVTPCLTAAAGVPPPLHGTAGTGTAPATQQTAVNFPLPLCGTTGTGTELETQQAAVNFPLPMCGTTGTRTVPETQQTAVDFPLPLHGTVPKNKTQQCLKIKHNRQLATFHYLFMGEQDKIS